MDFTVDVLFSYVCKLYVYSRIFIILRFIPFNTEESFHINVWLNEFRIIAAIYKLKHARMP